MKLLNQLGIALLLAVPSFGQTPTEAAAPGVPILLEAAVPMYPPIWRAAHLTGKVIVRVTVKEGHVVETAVQSGETHLQVPTTSNLKTWHFDDHISGTFTVSYTYEISGEPTDNPTNPKVEMLPSLDVKITARPVKPTVMYQNQSGSSADTSPHEAGHARGTSAP
jgi:hypothetical protein